MELLFTDSSGFHREFTCIIFLRCICMCFDGEVVHMRMFVNMDVGVCTDKKIRDQVKPQCGCLFLPQSC